MMYKRNTELKIKTIAIRGNTRFANVNIMMSFYILNAYNMRVIHVCLQEFQIYIMDK